jgi:hypothetical protein
MIRSGCRGFRTGLTELHFDVGDPCFNPVDLALIADDGHFQQGLVFWLCLSWHIG